VAPNAVLLADVDGDGESELLVGAFSGDLFVYKTLQQFTPALVVSGVGCVMALAAGDVRGRGRGVSVVVVAAGGQCSLLDFAAAADAPLAQPQITRLRAPPNISVALVVDSDGDGRQEIVLAGRNRFLFVCALRGEELAPLCEPLSLAGQACSLSSCAAADGGGPWLLVGLETGLELFRHRAGGSYDRRRVSLGAEPLSDNRVFVRGFAPLARPAGASAGEFSWAACSAQGLAFLAPMRAEPPRDLPGAEGVATAPISGQCMAIELLPRTREGLAGVAFCCWDGETYVALLRPPSTPPLQSGPPLLLRLDTQVRTAAFTAGLFPVRGGERPLPCLFYVSYEKTIIVCSPFALRHAQGPANLVDAASACEPLRALAARHGRGAGVSREELATWTATLLRLSAPGLAAYRDALVAEAQRRGVELPAATRKRIEAEDSASAPRPP
jgi:hypothetical protein